MQPGSVLLSLTCLLLFFCGCDKNDDHSPVPGPQKGLKGKLIHTSCATTAVQVLNRNVGSSWTNCHDQQSYQHMLDVTILNYPQGGIKVGDEFYFDIVDDVPTFRCAMADCGPSITVDISIVHK